LRPRSRTWIMRFMDEVISKPAGRFLTANRRQVVLRALDLEELIPDGDRARQIWAYVQQLDLSAFRDEVRSVEGSPGRPAIDPAILLSVWMLACAEAVGSSRKVAELCDKHHSYQWLCGGVEVEYRTLSNFRVRHAEKLDQVLSQGLAVLQSANLLEVTTIAQDGMRIRASAGSNSFRRKARLQDLQAQALQHVKQLREELEADPAACSRRQAAAKLRAAKQRQERLDEALKAVEVLEKHQKVREARDGKRIQRRQERPPKPPKDGEGGAGSEPQAKREPRVSTTDVEARSMRFSDGGYRPGYNAQFATDVGTGVIVGVGVTNNGSDCNQIAPMIEQVEGRLGYSPGRVLADAGYCAKQDIEAVAAKGVLLFSPVPKQRPVKRPRKKKDSEAVAAWRVRMASPEAEGTYKQRAAAAECTNADARQRGLYRVTVRGLMKVRPVLLLFAIVHNMMRTLDLMTKKQAKLAVA
jgi:transposase